MQLGREMGMALGTPLGAGGADQFAALFRPGDYWFDYRRRNGLVAVDYLDPLHTLAPSAGTPTLIAASANFLRRPALNCGGAVTLVSNRPASAFAHLHNGAGGSLFVISYRNAAGTNPGLFITRVGGVDPGAQFRGNTADVNGVLFVTDAGGGTVFFGGTLTNADPIGVPSSHYYSYSESRTPKMRLRVNTTEVVSTSTLGTPSAAAPGGTLTIAGTGADREFAAVFGFRRVLTAVEEAIVTIGARVRWGVTV